MVAKLQHFALWKLMFPDGPPLPSQNRLKCARINILLPSILWLLLKSTWSFSRKIFRIENLNQCLFGHRFSSSPPPPNCCQNSKSQICICTLFVLERGAIRQFVVCPTTVSNGYFIYNSRCCLYDLSQFANVFKSTKVCASFPSHFLFISICFYRINISRSAGNGVP